MPPRVARVAMTMGFEVTAQLKRRAADDIGWLTTVTPSGKPVPRPVWFVLDGDEILLFSQPHAAKVRHVEANPNVTLHFNAGHDGNDVLVIVGTAELLDESYKPSKAPGYLDKYESHYPSVGFDRDGFDGEYSTGIRIVPSRSWGW